MCFHFPTTIFAIGFHAPSYPVSMESVSREVWSNLCCCFVFVLFVSALFEGCTWNHYVVFIQLSGRFGLVGLWNYGLSQFLSWGGIRSCFLMAYPFPLLLFQPWCRTVWIRGLCLLQNLSCLWLRRDSSSLFADLALRALSFFQPLTFFGSSERPLSLSSLSEEEVPHPLARVAFTTNLRLKEASEASMHPNIPTEEVPCSNPFANCAAVSVSAVFVLAQPAFSILAISDFQFGLNNFET